MPTKKRKRAKCRPSFQISKAGHLLSTQADPDAGSLLATRGKKDKRKRQKSGCLNGTGDTFRLTDKQKRNLPASLQKAILAHHRKLGKRILP